MKEIKLANNRGIALVDDEDYEILSKYSWCLNPKEGAYAQTNIRVDGKRKTMFMHRFLLKLTNGYIADHIDGNGLNNQKANLRIVTPSQSCMNRSKFKNSSSKYKGVSWRKDQNKWAAYIRLNKKQIHLGYFESEINGAEAYNKAAKKLFGEFANLNIIEG